MTSIRISDLTDTTDKLVLSAHRAANAGDWGATMAAADEALKNDPKRFEAMFLAALALRKSKHEGVAAQLLHICARAEPKRWAVWLNLAQATFERHPRQAYEYARRAYELMPDHIDVLSTLVNISSLLGKHEEALYWAEEAEEKCGISGEVCHNKSFSLFALGRWKEAWEEFRASLGQANRRVRNYHAGRDTPRWNPNKHERATVVIYGEQGIGDEVMYASMIPAAIEAAAAKGSRVIIECYSRNADLFRQSFPDAKVFGTLRDDMAEWPVDEGVTHKIEMGGLGEYFGEEPFRGAAFLRTDEPRRCAGSAWLGAASPEGGMPKVGLAWTGGSWETGRDRRSIPFELILQLMRGQECTFVNLEYEPREQELEEAPHMLNPKSAILKGSDQADLAALLVNLDLVIAVQTSVVDLCGALGVPCWALVDEVPQWRYTGFFGDDTMGFYDSVKVYRQKTWGEWAPVIQRVSRDLKVWTEDRGSDAVAEKMNGAASLEGYGWSC